MFGFILVSGGGPLVQEDSGADHGAEGPGQIAEQGSVLKPGGETAQGRSKGGELKAGAVACGKEKQEEEDAWNELMEYIDAWIESLREGADIERSARAYADLQARRSERPVEVKTTSDYLLEKLEAYLAG